MSITRSLRSLNTVCRALPPRRALCTITRPTPTSVKQLTTRNISRVFSASALTRNEGASDHNLSQRLSEELKYEKEALASEDGTPEFLKAFSAEKIWAIEEKPGSDEVSLSRTFGDEQIRLMFSIADIDTTSEQQMLDPEEDENNSETEEEETPPSYPIRTSITITKPGQSPSALSIDAMCQDGVFTVDNIAFYDDAALATELSAEADWNRRGLYMGPQFDHLDVNVQEEFEKYLRERGIAEGLALFIPEYAEYKEQREYVKWLESVRKFLGA